MVLGDTMGDLRKFYSLATVIFVGRSLVPMGGSDMMEAAALGKCTIFGPHAFNFKQAVDDLLKADGAILVKDADELFNAMKKCLTDADYASTNRPKRPADNQKKPGRNGTHNNQHQQDAEIKSTPQFFADGFDVGGGSSATAADDGYAGGVDFLRGIGKLIGRYLINGFAVEQFGFTRVWFGENQHLRIHGLGGSDISFGKLDVFIESSCAAIETHSIGAGGNKG